MYRNRIRNIQSKLRNRALKSDLKSTVTVDRLKIENKLIQLFQLRLSPSKAEKSNTSAKSLLGVTIKNTQTEQNSVSRDT